MKKLNLDYTRFPHFAKTFLTRVYENGRETDYIKDKICDLHIENLEIADIHEEKLACWIIENYPQIIRSEKDCEYCALHRSVKIVKQILKFNQVPRSGIDCARKIKLLYEYECIQNYRDSKGNNWLHISIEKNSIPGVNFFIDLFETPNDDGKHPRDIVSVKTKRQITNKLTRKIFESSPNRHLEMFETQY